MKILSQSILNAPQKQIAFRQVEIKGYTPPEKNYGWSIPEKIKLHSFWISATGEDSKEIDNIYGTVNNFPSNSPSITINEVTNCLSCDINLPRQEGYSENNFLTERGFVAKKHQIRPDLVSTPEQDKLIPRLCAIMNKATVSKEIENPDAVLKLVKKFFRPENFLK